MARARNIKPSIMDNEELAELDALTRLFFVYLWMLADREGRVEDRPKRIAARALPYDRAADVGAMLRELDRAGFIARYTVGDVAVIQILNFSKHQTPHGTEKDSELPDEHGVLTVHVRGKNGYSTGETRSVNSGLTVKELCENTLNPDSLIPDSPNEDSQPAAPAAAARAPKKGQKTSLPDGFGVSERVQAWAAEKGYGQLDQHLEAFKRKAIAKGYTYASWDDAFMEAIREDWAKLRGRGNGAAPPPDIQAPKGRDAALIKIDADAQKAVPMPADIREKLAGLTKKLTGEAA